ncbi:phospholipase A [Thauera linaloolentis]|uniref:Phospholipase A1 n=1 Tax=Thauera linaloolentis (strain DSM 12138 / JCM 21573 / CCUG 41526 / CIP 105981 / IAM 15112 / NBRC 102519 / 47Lol) TaxID=1123367 RepID=N6ZC13_THAL4|nr:phospholipase A [Thauera linaloolentis]ENO89724.1 hypothetical protein C666_04745 [Thauera linaloolentis 47Lol = DSM 12138]MCM8566022.1 phospholipase A [Thauera linaloolentis]
MLGFTSLPALASGWLLASPEPRVVPGQSFGVVVIGLPDGADLPERLPAQIELPDGGPRIALELVAAAPADERSRQRRYLGRWPDEVVGFATLSLQDAASARIVMDAGAAVRTPVQTAQAAAASGGDTVIPAAATASAAVAPSALGAHEPMYFLVGGEDPVSARFQFSFRYRVFDDHGVVAEHFPVARGLYFGFTQTSLWDLESDSKPFRDTSFRPSLFYRWHVSDPERGGFFALSGGYEHESNGEDDEDSRSIDTLFLKAEGRYYLDDGLTYFGLEPKVWTYLDRDDNPDIARYRGYAELGLRYGKEDGLMLTSLLRRGTAGKMRRQFDLSYPLRRSIFSGVGAFIHLQYLGGYGETLLDYDKHKDGQWRIGISLVR